MRRVIVVVVGSAVVAMTGLSCQRAAQVGQVGRVVPSGLERPPSPHQELAEVMPHPAPPPTRSEPAEVLNAECERCHREIASEWRGSLHQGAHVDPEYQRAFAIEPLAFCQGCHAPEGATDLPVSAASAALGVSCVTCHVTAESTILAASPAAATHVDAGSAKGHAVLKSAAFSTGAACGSCHEFGFPDSAIRGGVELMQSTMSEHTRSKRSDMSCAGCHMRWVGEGD